MTNLNAFQKAISDCNIFRSTLSPRHNELNWFGEPSTDKEIRMNQIFLKREKENYTLTQTSPKTPEPIQKKLQKPTQSDPDNHILVKNFSDLLKKHGKSITSQKSMGFMEKNVLICHENIGSYGNAGVVITKSLSFFRNPSSSSTSIKNIRSKIDTNRTALIKHQRDSVILLGKCEKTFRERLSDVDKSADSEKYILHHPDNASINVQEIDEKIEAIDRDAIRKMQKISTERKEAIEVLKNNTEYIEKSLLSQQEKLKKTLVEAENALSAKKTKEVNTELEICKQVYKLVKKNNAETKSFLNLVTNYISCGTLPKYVPKVVHSPLVVTPIVTVPIVVKPRVASTPVQKGKSARRGLLTL